MGELKKLVEEGKIKELGIGIVAYSPLGRGFLSSGAKMVDNLSDNDSRKETPISYLLRAFDGQSKVKDHLEWQVLEPTKVPAGDLEHNKILYERVSEIATRKGCTPSQLALAWVHHQGDDVCPSPGTTKIENLNQNIWALLEKPTPEEMAELESIASADAVKGDRYQSITLTWKTSDTPPLASWKA
uniref:NADP-dependent oxidoreductase domain-containing protein n=1 Tax=Vitis vinifera TaxID=29760 RepID=A5BW95_VITVI|nr:hypothetical protein VITISV_020057 [Vitis vinifera]